MSASKSPFIIVGLSGGVDSSVAALLLKQQGYRVEGVFMKNWEEDDTETYCSASSDIADAQAVCDQLQIPLHITNFSQQYWDKVFQYFLTEYRAGRTPNPDILCNKEIKFRAFLDYAQQLGADFIATGHYARLESVGEQYHLLKAADLNKDQTYFLYALEQNQLAHSVFPLGTLTKPEVRQLAKQAGFPNHAKKDSTGICFIGERKFKTFLQHYLPAQPGNIETVDGNWIGKHDGLMYYTLGQRQGLKIGGQRHTDNSAWYVVQKDLARNTLIVAQGKSHPLLFKNTLFCSQLNWLSGIAPTFPFTCTAKTRYRQTDQACTLFAHNENQCRVEFEAPQWAITPGQSVVFYQQDHCLGGGIIDA